MSEKINILLIEDNKSDEGLFHVYLREGFGSAFTLAAADYLHKGLALVKETRFDVIIVDLTLPDSGGVDTFKAVYDAAPEIPIIVLTGLEDESMGITTVKLGAQDFLIKGTLNAKTLRKTINYSIERYKLLKSLAENAKMLAEKTADLLSEKQKLSQAQKLAHIGSWEWNIKTNNFSCSDEMLRILKLDESEKLTYERFLDFLHKEDKQHVIGEIKKAIKRARSFDFFHRVVCKDHSVRYLHAKGEMLADKDGEILKVIGTAQDITQKKKEEQLEQLALVAIKSFNAVTIADREGRIEWVNEGFTRLFGYKLRDVKGSYGEILRKGEKTGLSPDNEYYKMLIRDKKPLSYENKNYSKDGREYWVLTSLTPLLDENGEVEKIISIDSDITRRKRAEQELIIANKIAEHSIYKSNKALEELHKAKKQIEESLKVKEQFLANMSHEIRTPMNAIIGFTNLLLKKELDTENRQYLNAIKTSGQNLLVIINDILDFSKLESGKISLESIPFKLRQVVATVVDLMLPKAIEKYIKLSYSIDESIPETLLGDPTRLNQVLINLVGNAIKFTNEGGVRVTITKLDEQEEELSLRFSVTDTGIGIPPESLDKIFEGFTQASNDTTRKYGGTGLGLTITKQLIELQGGEISVSSKVGEGSSFVFWLRFKKDLRQEAPEPEEKEVSKQQYPLENTRILLVEDNLFNQMLAAKILENWHCKVDIAGNGIVATEKAAGEDYDLILMDIQLPEMDGYQATTYIRNKIPAPKNRVPIIAMTAHAFPEEIEKCKKFGMDDYISKPFDENKLYKKIGQILASGSNPTPRASVKEDPRSNGKPPRKLVNLEYLKKVSHNDAEFVSRMISVFLNQSPVLLESMKQFAEQKDKNALKAVIHRMRPSIAFMGMNELEHKMIKLETCLQDGATHEEILSYCDEIREMCNEAMQQLEDEKTHLEGKSQL